MDSKQFKGMIETILPQMGEKYSHTEAVDLLMMTWAHESKGGRYIEQVGGPALGFFQMEPDTLADLYLNYLGSRKGKSDMVDRFTIETDFVHATFNLEFSIAYQITTCRMQYYRFSEAIPKRPHYNGRIDYLHALSRYAKKYWNTEAGKATPEKYFNDYMTYVGLG